MKLRQLLQALPFAALLATSAAVVTLPSCSSKNGSPVPPGINGVELKCEFSIEAGAPVNLSWLASTGGDPNIYRDGKLVAQSFYNEDSADKAIKKLQTTFTHRGIAPSASALSLSVPRVRISLPRSPSASSRVSIVRGRWCRPM